MADFDTTEVADGSLETKRTLGDLVEPSTSDETQEKKEKELTVLVNCPAWTILDDGGDLEVRSKEGGFGIHIGGNGDIAMLTGSPAADTKGGRFAVNSHGPLVLKSEGPILTEANADSDSGVDGEGSTSSGKSGREGLARSDVNSGDWISETHGSVKIQATNIIIEAADVLALKAKNTIMIQAGPSGGGDIMMQAGQITESSGISRKIVSSRKETIGAAEETAVQFDPRASRNIISAGHINMKALGDMKVNTLGCASMHFAGNPVPVGSGIRGTLVKDRKTALNVGTKLGNLAVGTGVGSILIESGGLGFANGSGLIPGSVSVKAKSNVDIEALFIYLN